MERLYGRRRSAEVRKENVRGQRDIPEGLLVLQKTGQTGAVIACQRSGVVCVESRLKSGHGVESAKGTRATVAPQRTGTGIAVQRVTACTNTSRG